MPQTQPAFLPSFASRFLRRSKKEEPRQKGLFLKEKARKKREKGKQAGIAKRRREGERVFPFRPGTESTSSTTLFGGGLGKGESTDSQLGAFSASFSFGSWKRRKPLLPPFSFLEEEMPFRKKEEGGEGKKPIGNLCSAAAAAVGLPFPLSLFLFPKLHTCFFCFFFLSSRPQMTAPHANTPWEQRERERKGESTQRELPSSKTEHNGKEGGGRERGPET